MLSSGACGGASGLGCDTVCACEIVQVPGTARDQNTDLYACQNELTPRASINGYCLIDLTRMDLNGAFVPLGNPELVADCPQNTKRWLRFLGAGFPSAGATSFIGCAAMPLL